MLVVVVLPCVPAIAMVDFRRISSASISARRTTGMRFSSAASTSGLVRLTAVEVTTTATPSTFSRAWPIATSIPRLRSRSTVGPSAMSEPCT